MAAPLLFPKAGAIELGPERALALRPRLAGPLLQWTSIVIVVTLVGLLASALAVIVSTVAHWLLLPQ